MTRKDRSELARQAGVLEDGRKDKPEQYRIKVVEAAPASVVSVQDPNGAPGQDAKQRKILALAQGPAQVMRGGRESCRRRIVGEHRALAHRRPPMRFASIGSGSEGNGLVVEAGATRLMIDCGFGVRDTAARLARIGVAPESLAAIIVTHEHADHVGGVPAFAARHGIPVWLTFGTLEIVGERFADMERVYGFDSHDRFAIGDLEVCPFPVPHDAREPVQFVVGDGAFRLGVLTDLGTTTRCVEMSLTGLRRAGARMQPRSRIAGAQRLPRVAQAADQRSFRPPAQRRRLRSCCDRSTTRGSSTSSPPIFRSRTTRRRWRARALAGALGCTTDWIGGRRTRRTASTGAQLS